jgi:hypothetical protein
LIRITKVYQTAFDDLKRAAIRANDSALLTQIEIAAGRQQVNDLELQQAADLFTHNYEADPEYDSELRQSIVGFLGPFDDFQKNLYKRQTSERIKSLIGGGQKIKSAEKELENPFHFDAEAKHYLRFLNSVGHLILFPLDPSVEFPLGPYLTAVWAFSPVVNPAQNLLAALYRAESSALMPIRGYRH